MAPRIREFKHSSSIFNREPPWSSIAVAKLPELASDPKGRAHHWVRDGKVGADGKYLSGEIYLHRGAAIEAYRKGLEKGEPPADLSHLKEHLDAIGYKAAVKREEPGQDLEIELLGADRIEAEIDVKSGRAPGDIEPWEMEAINRTARVPLRKEEVYTFPGWISNGEQDSYFTRMDPETTLRNFVADLLSTRGLCIAHAPGRGGMLGPVGEAAGTMPVGKSFHGELVDRPEKPGTKWVRGHWYIVRGVAIPAGVMKTDDVIRNIDTGVWDRLSVGLTLNPIEGRPRGWYRCDICKENLMSSDCEHIPGLEYDGKTATATIIDGSMRESSMVYLNAAQGTVISKARHLAETGLLKACQIETLEHAYGVRIFQPDGGRSLGALKPRKTGGNPATVTEETDMDLARELLKGLIEAFRSVLPESPLRVKAKDLQARVESAEAETGLREASTVLAGLISESRADYAAVRAVHDALPETDRAAPKVAVLIAEAAEGRQYRADLVKEALAEGVRAQANDFNKAHWEKALGKESLEFIKTQRDEWKKMADAKIVAGQRSSATPGAGIPIVEPDKARVPAPIPDAAFNTRTK